MIFEGGDATFNNRSSDVSSAQFQLPCCSTAMFLGQCKCKGFQLGQLPIQHSRYIQFMSQFACRCNCPRVKRSQVFVCLEIIDYADNEFASLIVVFRWPICNGTANEEEAQHTSTNVRTVVEVSLRTVSS